MTEKANFMARVANTQAKADGKPPRFIATSGPLDADELETILTIARNRQSGRITEYEIKALVSAYKQLHGI